MNHFISNRSLSFFVVASAAVIFAVCFPATVSAHFPDNGHASAAHEGVALHTHGPTGNAILDEVPDDGSAIDGDDTETAENDDGTVINDDEDTEVAAVPTAIAFKNPIAFNDVDGLLSRVLVTIQSIVAVLAILFIVIGAIIYITSGGNQQRTELAKNAIFAALIGLALALAAPSFLKEIYTAIGGNPTDEITGARSLTEIALNITRFLLSIVGVLSIVMLVSGGIIYILSAGDQTRTDTAKRTIMYAIIGLVVALVSLVIVGQVVGVIGS